MNANPILPVASPSAYGRASRMRKWVVCAVGVGPCGIVSFFVLLHFLPWKWVLLLPTSCLNFVIGFLLLPVLAGVVAAYIFSRANRHDEAMRLELEKIERVGELGVAVLLIGTLIALMFPGYIRAALRATASCVLSSNMRQTDAAKDQYSLENSKQGSVQPTWADLSPYLKAGCKLAREGGNDEVGNPMIIGRISERMRVNPRTKEALKDAADDAFWGPFS